MNIVRIKKPFSVNLDVLKAIIYLGSASMLLEDINKKRIFLNDKRFLNSIARLDGICRWIISYKLELKHKKRLLKLFHEYEKKKRFAPKDTPEFETLFIAYCNFYFASEIFKTIPEIKFPCCYAMNLIKQYLVKKYHISKKPEMKEKIINITAEILLGLEEDGYIQL